MGVLTDFIGVVEGKVLQGGLKGRELRGQVSDILSGQRGGDLIVFILLMLKTFGGDRNL